MSFVDVSGACTRSARTVAAYHSKLLEELRRALTSFREPLARELSAEDVPPARALDMIVAATEVVRNAIGHGAGLRELRVGRTHGRFV